MYCKVCKNKLRYGDTFNAIEYGYDTYGTVKTYICENTECNLFYELIQLNPKCKKDSDDFYTYGQNYIKFYQLL